AAPAISAWCLKTVAERVSKEGEDLVAISTGLNIRATHNKRTAGNANIVTWDRLSQSTMTNLEKVIREQGPAIWLICSKFAQRPVAKGRIYRPPDVVCTGSISSMMFSRSRSANLYQMANGMTLFGSKAHTSTFRVLSRVGYTVSLRSVTNALRTGAKLTLSGLGDGIRTGKSAFRIVMDNVQAFAKQRDFRLGRESKMITGCAATVIEMENCDPAAFDMEELERRRKEKLRQNLTVPVLAESINEEHLYCVSTLHWLLTLVSFVPALKGYRSGITKLFHDKASILPMPKNRKTKIHPLGTNSHNEAKTQGLRDALDDFLQKQLGIDSDNPKLFPVSGDGMTFEQIHRVKKYMSSHSKPLDSFKYVVPVLEIWHTKWKDLCRIISTHWGDGKLKDPSALGSSAAAIGVPRPADLSKVDYYPGVHTVSTVAKARMLDCWVNLLGTDDLEAHFTALKESNALPTLETLELQAALLAKRYSSTRAYHMALRGDQAGDPDFIFPEGPAWHAGKGEKVEKVDEVGKVDVVENSNKTEADKTDVKFSGDRVLANSILFLRDAIWFMEACYAVASGDMGRVYEIMKVWMFTFSGSSHPKYASYLLEVFCNFEYEFPEPLKRAILLNWLVNLSGEDGHFIEADLMQEHFNFWLEELAQHKGHEFDEAYYREVIAPAVHHFLRLKEEREASVGLTRRTKSHGAPSLTNEYKRLLQIYKERNLHRFCAGREMGHVAKDNFAEGFKKLSAGKLQKFV
ncbi:hypothetical protein BOTBODRAFT_77208, partial [Botryobasidium botryosum FD-172 SS1]